MSLMRVFFFLSLLLWVSPAMADPLEGRWLFYKKIYRNIEMPEPPEATLRLYFEFLPNGTNHLYWFHVGEDDHCERHAEYSLEEGTLVEKVIWVNPENSPSCSRDPDMQLGKVSRTPVSFHNGEFWLHLFLGDEPLVYVWKRDTL